MKKKPKLIKEMIIPAENAKIKIMYDGIYRKKIAEFFTLVGLRFGLVGFYGMSTIVGYLMLNLLYAYILDI